MKRRFNRKRTFRKKRSYKKYSSSRYFQKAVRSAISRNVEKKYTSFTGVTAVAVAGILLRFTEPGQGTSDITRIGDQITIRSLQFNYDITVADATNYVRVILFQWFPPTGAAGVNLPVSVSILLDIVSPWISPYSHDNRYNFRILYDKTHLIDGVSLPATSRKVMIKRFPPTHKKIQYVGASTTNYINGLFAFIFSDSGAVAHPSFNYSGKFNYSDA